MIMKGLIGASIGVFSAVNFQPFNLMAETLNEVDLKINDNIKVLSSYYGALSKKDGSSYLEAQVSENIEDGDMLFLAITTSGGVHENLPEGFTPIISTVKKKGDLTVRTAYKIWLEGDPLIYTVKKEARNFFLSLITIRGPKYVVDAKARINTADGCNGESIAPRVESQDGGALLTVFSYIDPHAVTIARQETLVSLKNGDDGIAVGISSTDGGLSRRIMAASDSCKRGGGDDIAAAISIF